MIAPSKAILTILVNADLADDPTVPDTDQDGWPIFYSQLPDGEKAPDNAISIRDTVGKTFGRHMETGVVIEHPGIQIMVRSNRYDDAYNKIAQIRDFLDSLKRTSVVIGTDTVTIATVNRGGVLALGKVGGNRPRDAFSLNATVSFV